jgi:ABC-type arginine/histidine transport system permease subunit
MNNLPNPFSGALLTMLLLALALLIGLLLPVLVLTVQTGDRGTYGRA